MRSHGHPDLTATEDSFIVHFEKCWLGASPDAWVTDPSAVNVNGLAEFKCPYTKADKLPEEACEDAGFCCLMIDGKLQLKRNHTYYHQVQLQLLQISVSGMIFASILQKT